MAPKLTVITGCVILMLAGCGSSDFDSDTTRPPPAPPPAATDFTAFVKTQFDNTADTTDPVAVDNTDFDFADDEDPTAFDDLLQ